MMNVSNLNASFNLDNCSTEMRSNRCSDLDATQASGNRSGSQGRLEAQQFKSVFSGMVKNISYQEISQRIFSLRETYTVIDDCR